MIHSQILSILEMPFINLEIPFVSFLSWSLCFWILYTFFFLNWKVIDIKSYTYLMYTTWWFWEQIYTMRASLVVIRVKNPLAMQETQVWSLGQEDPLEKRMSTYSSILAWRIPCAEESGQLQSIESDTTEQLTLHFTHTYDHHYHQDHKHFYHLPKFPLSLLLYYYGYYLWKEHLT